MAKRQHKIKIFLSIGKIPCFCQKNSKNPEKLIVFQGFYSGQHFYPLNMVEATRFELTTSWSRTKRATKLRYASIATLIISNPRAFCKRFTASFSKR